MHRLFNKSRVLLSVYLAYMSEYRAELFLWALAGLLPFVMMGIWMQASAAAGDAMSMTPLDMQRYFLAVFIIRQMTVVWVIWEFEFHVVSGRLSPYLLQPLDPAWRFIAQHICDQIIRVPFAMLLVVVFFVLYPQALWMPDPLAVLQAAVLIALAFAARFLMQYSLATGCFWFERIGGMEQLLFMAYLFLSGLVAPLERFPEAVRTFALWTPFPYMVYVPAQLLTGIRTPGFHVSFMQGLLVMVGWVAVFFVINRWLWRRGLRNYSAMGA
ncbi:MAG: ABC-2 family transporter protein [Phycisphaeraceae bacterium]